MVIDRRTLIALAAAIVLPLLVFGALETAAGLAAQRRAVEQDYLARAREANALVDGLLQSDLGALEVFASSGSVVEHRWARARARAAALVAARPRWRDLALTDARTGQELWDTASPLDRPRPARASVAHYLAVGRGRSMVDGVYPGAPPCPCAALHTPVIEQGRLAYVVTLEISPDDFQGVLWRAADPRPGGTAGLFDRDGRFIARTLNPRARVGAFGSTYVRAAIHGGHSGFYRGVTLEGLRNYTAFETSALSGWSTHIAIPDTPVAALQWGALAFTWAAAIAALCLAALISAFALARLRERRAAEMRRRQSQKLEAIGQIASGVAHDFNNLLTIVIGNLRRLEGVATEAQIERPVRHALDAAERGAGLARQLLDFARDAPITVGPVDLGRLLESTRGLISEALGPGIALAIQVPPDARPVRGAADLLEMALMNLAVNARDAMAGGGTLSIAVRPSRLGRDRMDLEVRDTGHGMAPEVLERLLEPFFTTKAPGKGTGLGMMQVLRAVNASEGTLDITSTVGVGTTVTIRLPVWRG